MRNFSSHSFFVGLLIALSFPCIAKHKDIAPVQDAEVRQSTPDGNFGELTNLTVQSADGATLNDRFWLQYDVTGKIPPGATISSVKLRLYLFGADQQGDPLDIEVLGNTNDSWTETSITWNNQPGAGLIDGTFDSTPAAGNSAAQISLVPNEEFLWYEVDVTDFAVSEISGDGTVSLMVKAVTENENQWRTYDFDSREFSTNFTPRLRIDFTGDWPTADPVNIIHINDIHSRLTTHDLDFPDADGEAPAFEEAGGVAYVATKVLELKQAAVNSLILDAGDISEGNPLGDLRGNGGTIDFFEELDSQLKALPGNTSGRGVDAIVVGNHDVRAISMVNNMTNSSLPFISVNILNEGAAIPTPGPNPTSNAFAPYVLIDADHDANPSTDNIRVAVLGYSTDDSTILTDETINVLDVAEVRWTDTDASTIDLKDWVEYLRLPASSGGEGADIVVLLSHIGHRRLNATDEALLGDLGAVAPPDVVISGHWHTWTDTAWQPSNLNYNTTNVEAASYGQYVGELQITDTGRYVGSTKHPIRVSDILPNAGMETLINTLTAEYDALTDHPCVLPPAVTGRASATEPCPLNHVVGYSADDLMLDKDKWFTLSEFPWSGDNTAGEWVSDSMVWKAQSVGESADLALQSGGGIRRDVAAGEITYLEIYETYPWSDDQMVQVQMSSQDVWNYLESHFVGSSISEGWQVTADDGIITDITYQPPAPAAPIVLSETDSTTLWFVIISEFMFENDDWINESGSSVTFQSLGLAETPLGLSIRDSVVEYTAQFTQQSPMTVAGPRYILNTEFAGGFRAVVTMTNDAESQPYFEAVFVRLLDATSETVARRDSYGLSDLVNADGSINTENQFAETMLYRSHLGFPDGVLQVGDVLEIWGEGGFFDGNPQFVDQQGIIGAEQEFVLLGNDTSLAQPELHSDIASFFNEENENHLVVFRAEKTGVNTVRDVLGQEITVYKSGGFFSADSLPGTVGDIIELVGVQTERASGSPSRRFRLRDATVVTGYLPVSQMIPLIGEVSVGDPITLAADAVFVSPPSSGDCSASVLEFTSFEEPGTGDRYTDPNTSSHALANITGLADVVYDGAGSELGFSAFFTSTGSADGLSDGDFVGVTSFTGDVGSYTDGTQGYQLNDIDGILTVTLDTVDLSGQSTVTLCADMFVNPTGWETADRIRLWVNNGSNDIDLINTNGSDIDDLTIDGLPIEDSWHTLSVNLDGAANATFNFELESNAAAESLYIDNVRFTSGGSTATGEVTQVEFFYSIDGGQTFLSAGVDTDGSDGWSVDFIPSEAGNYQFYSLATNSDALTEYAPVNSDANISVVALSTPDSTQVPIPFWMLGCLAISLLGVGFGIHRRASL